MPKAVNHSGCAINTTAHSVIRSRDLAHCSQACYIPLDHCDLLVKPYARRYEGYKNFVNAGASSLRMDGVAEL